MPLRPSLFTILTTDYTALNAAFTPLILWPFVLLMYFLTPEDARRFAVFGAVITPLALVILLWRLRFIYSLFDNGQTVPGKVLGLRSFTARGRIFYAYTHQGQDYKTSNAIYVSGRIRRLRPGDPVTIVLDPAHPQRALIRDVYLPSQ